MTEKRKRALPGKQSAQDNRTEQHRIIISQRTKSREKAANEQETRIQAERAARRAAASPELVASLAHGDRVDRERKRFGRRPRIANVRTGELRRLFAERYGRGEPMIWTFPNDDAGRDDALLFVTIRLSAGVTAAAASRELLRFAPWLTEAEAAAVAANAASERQQERLTAKAIGRRLNLTDDARTRLKIRTIAAVDLSDAEREARRKARDAERARARRAMKRAAAMAPTGPKVDPWTEQGISRATYYRRNAVRQKAVRHISINIYGRREKVSSKTKARRRRPEGMTRPAVLH